MRNALSRCLGVGLALACLAGAGCVEGEVRTFLAYDRGTDSFKCLEVYTNLSAVDKKDHDHLAALYAKRGTIITNPIDIHIFGRTAYERKGKHSYQAISLGQPQTKEPETRKTKVDLSMIRVIPGEFYLNTHGNLSYYHQVVVPGKTIDALLVEVKPLVAKGLAELAEEQIKLATKGKARKLTWDELRKELVAEIRKDKAKAAPKKKEEELLPFEEESLRLLKKAGEDGSVVLGRTGDDFRIVVPLTKKDSEEVVTTAALARKTIAGVVKKGGAADKGVLELLAGVRLRQVEGGVEVTASFTKLAKALRSFEGLNLNPAPDPKKAKGYQALLAAMQGGGIKINKEGPPRALIEAYTK
jgi:hypothetical protein